MRQGPSRRAARGLSTILSAAALLLVSGPGSARLPAGGEVRWTWTGSDKDRRAVLIRLARGSIRIIRRPGPVKIRMQAHSNIEDPRAVTFKVVKGSRQITIVERYWRGMGRGAECLPPLDDRGAFWDHDVVVNVLVRAPEGIPVNADIMDPREG